MKTENEKIKIIHENKNLIYKIASKYVGYYSMDDLVQVGVIGIIKAIDNYNDTSDAKFTTYAYKYILGEIIKYISNERMIKVSPEILKIYKSYEKANEVLTAHLGRVPSFIEICDFLGIEPAIVSDAIEKCEFSVSLESTLNDEDYTLEKVIGSDTTRQIDELVDLKSALEKLPETERKIIELRYFRDYTQTQTAEILGWNQVQVSRYEKHILKKMKTNITA